MHKPARLRNSNMFSHVWNMFYDVSWGLQINKPPLVYSVFPKTDVFYLKETSKIAKISLKLLLEVVGLIYA